MSLCCKAVRNCSAGLLSRCFERIQKKRRKDVDEIWASAYAAKAVRNCNAGLLSRCFERIQKKRRKDVDEIWASAYAAHLRDCLSLPAGYI
jgi:ribosomal protein S17E